MKKEKQKSKLRLFRQNKFYTCAVAYLRMVLDVLGCEIDEPSVAAICKTDMFGTTADNLVRGARELGFEARKEYSHFIDLQNYLAEEVFPILYVNLLSIDGLDITHAFVLEAVSRGSVKVLDLGLADAVFPLNLSKSPGKELEISLLSLIKFNINQKEDVIMIETKVGVVRKYFAKPGVAAIELTLGSLKVGDTIHIKGHTTDFQQEVTSMQIENQPIEQADQGSFIGVKVKERVRDHDEVFKVED
ncbi:MAG: cysteine peptidase family C39 domain-containing protein [candidate division KSB1 bacterium]|nr:cysteine peptidase family C39 domain-containing protein [candidate division KSB1 bacterium]